MSSISSLLFVLYAAFCSSGSARQLGVATSKEHPEINSHYFFSNNKKSNVENVEPVVKKSVPSGQKEELFLPKKVEVAASNNKDTMISIMADIQKQKPIRGNISRTGSTTADESSSSSSSLVSKSWRLVPRKKRGEKQPGFNLDYLPPKTHPPSHNR